MTDNTVEPAAVAAATVGMAVDEAVAAVAAAGLEPVVVPPGTTAVTMDFRPQRIRLFLDDDAVRVARATAG